MEEEFKKCKRGIALFDTQLSDYESFSKTQSLEQARALASYCEKVETEASVFEDFEESGEEESEESEEDDEDDNDEDEDEKDYEEQYYEYDEEDDYSEYRNEENWNWEDEFFYECSMRKDISDHDLSLFLDYGEFDRTDATEFLGTAEQRAEVLEDRRIEYEEEVKQIELDEEAERNVDEEGTDVKCFRAVLGDKGDLSPEDLAKLSDDEVIEL
jgi:hypothetical protein